MEKTKLKITIDSEIETFEVLSDGIVYKNDLESQLYLNS